MLLLRIVLRKSRYFGVQICSRYLNTSILPEIKIRNIGILAHIDAGKTTTTERMLFYSGKTRTLGEVHHGNTVTDFLSQERERGITICSAAVSLPWKDHRINLLDTPGHIDFTMEVEQSLGAVDGTVIILDATAGVEAQTVTVWSQADHYKLPRMVFANKMDRPDASFEQCLNDIKAKLGAIPIATQIPIMSQKGLTGIIDILNLKELKFDGNKDGRVYQLIPLSGDLLDKITLRRCELIDLVSGHDDILADVVIGADCLENIETNAVLSAIRRCTLDQKLVPVLLGSAYKNTGVQPLMNAVLQFLPAPNERNVIYDCFGTNFAGKVFKVTHDKHRGALTLVRVLRGTLKKGAKITTSRETSEQVQRIFEPLADEYRDVDEVIEGNIGVCAGLKETKTGDLLVSNVTSLKTAKKKLLEAHKSSKHTLVNEKDDAQELVSKVLQLGTKVPDAVYFCSVEPQSLAYQNPLEAALVQLQREDPSLRVRYDETTMQTVLGGMGELHLDIVKSRLLTEYKLEVDLGPLQIAYKETIEEPVRDTIYVKKEIAGIMQEVSMEMSLVQDKDEIFNLDTQPEAAHALSQVRPKYFPFVKKGAIAALDRGPRLGGQVEDTQIILHALVIGRKTADSFVMSVASQCVQKLLVKTGCRLLEPIMSLDIILPAERSSQVLADLARRRPQSLEVTARGDNKVISADAPLAELGGYSTKIRTMTSGESSMSMQPNGYSIMQTLDEERAIRIAQGLE